MDATHYIAREDGRIKAAVGAYPLVLDFPEGSAPGRGIGMVSVHPYCRSRNHMKTLMNLALADMRRDRVAFSCLGGQRQRYEYFGFTPAGSGYTFTCGEANIRHSLGHRKEDWGGDFSLQGLDSGDEVLLDKIQALHEAKSIRIRRSRERLFDILSSWKAQVLGVLRGGEFQGYMVACRGNISEINLRDYSRLPDVIGLFLRDRHETEAQVSVASHETEKIAGLSCFAETYRISPAYHFAVFDYPTFLTPFLRLKSQMRTLQDGSFSFQIEGGPLLELSVQNGRAFAEEKIERKNVSRVMSANEALQFLCSFSGESVFPEIRENLFLRSLLPLPLFFESPDHI
jgi:hypothetical protein